MGGFGPALILKSASQSRLFIFLKSFLGTWTSPLKGLKKVSLRVFNGVQLWKTLKALGAKEFRQFRQRPRNPQDFALVAFVHVDPSTLFASGIQHLQPPETGAPQTMEEGQLRHSSLCFASTRGPKPSPQKPKGCLGGASIYFFAFQLLLRMSIPFDQHFLVLGCFRLQSAKPGAILRLPGQRRWLMVDELSLRPVRGSTTVWLYLSGFKREKYSQRPTSLLGIEESTGEQSKSSGTSQASPNVRQ